MQPSHFFLTGAGHAEQTEKTAVPASELQAKMAYCENCHGVSARGFHGYYPIPRLAGQQPEYIKNQLQAFIEHRRTNNIMFNVAHVLSPAMLDALTDSFQKLNPKPLVGAAPKDLVAAGKKIYEEGLPAIRRSAVRLLSWPRGKGRRTISAPGRAAERLHRQQAEKLDEGARSKSVKA